MPFLCARFAGVYVHGLPDFSDKCLINLILGYLPCRIARLSDNSCTWIMCVQFAGQLVHMDKIEKGHLICYCVSSVKNHQRYSFGFGAGSFA